MTASFATLPPTRPATYAEAVERFVVSSGVRSGSRRQYRISLTTWAWLFAGEQPPLGRARRGATPPQLLFAGLSSRSLRGKLLAVEIIILGGIGEHRELTFERRRARRQ